MNVVQFIWNLGHIRQYDLWPHEQSAEVVRIWDWLGNIWGWNTLRSHNQLKQSDKDLHKLIMKSIDMQWLFDGFYKIYVIEY